MIISCPRGEPAALTGVVAAVGTRSTLDWPATLCIMAGLLAGVELRRFPHDLQLGGNPLVHSALQE